MNTIVAALLIVWVLLGLISNVLCEFYVRFGDHNFPFKPKPFWAYITNAIVAIIVGPFHFLWLIILILPGELVKAGVL